MLRALATAGELPLPPASSMKRPRIEEVDDFTEQTSSPPLQMPPVSRPPPPQQRAVDASSRESGEVAKHVLKRLVPSTPSEMSVFGPPLAQRADGLYPFDPASTGMTTSTASYSDNASQGNPPEPQIYRPAAPTHSNYTYSASYPSIPLDPSSTYTSTPYTPSHATYRSAPQAGYSQNNYSFLNATGSDNMTASSSQTTNIEDTQFMSLLGPAMSQDAPMAAMWSSLPATFQYVSAFLQFEQVLIIPGRKTGTAMCQL